MRTYYLYTQVCNVCTYGGTIYMTLDCWVYESTHQKEEERPPRAPGPQCFVITAQADEQLLREACVPQPCWTYDEHTFNYMGRGQGARLCRDGCFPITRQGSAAKWMSCGRIHRHAYVLAHAQACVRGCRDPSHNWIYRDMFNIRNNSQRCKRRLLSNKSLSQLMKRMSDDGLCLRILKLI